MDKIVDTLVQIQLPALLRKVADLHSGADVHRAAVRGQLPGKQPQQRGFSGAVVSHNADAVIPQQIVGKVPDDGSALVGLADIMKLNELFAKAAGRRSHLHCIVRLRGVLIFQRLVPLDTVSALGGPGPAAPHDPLPLRSQNGLPFPLAGFRHLRPLGLQLQIFGIVGLVMIQLAPAQLRDVVHHPLQKVAVMGHHHQPALEPAEPVLQPGSHLRVQMVGGLIQNQHIRRMNQRRRQRHPLPLSAGEGTHLLLIVRQAQLVEHGLGLIFIQLPEFLGEMQEYLLQNGGVILHGGILLQQAYLHVGIPGNRSGVSL